MYYINKGTNSQSGSGHPFTDVVNFLFCVRSGQEVGGGLPKLPVGTLPAAQIHVQDYGTLISAELLVSNGDGTFGTSLTIPALALEVTAISKNGVSNWYSWSILDSYVLAGMTTGRYIIKLVLSDGVVEKEYYSEEFLTTICC